MVFFSLAMLASHARASAVEMAAPDEVRALIAPAVEALGPQLEKGDALERVAALRRARRAIEDVLAAEGWFSPRIDTVLEPSPRVEVSPGARSRVESVEILFTGEIEGATFGQRREQLRASWFLPAGAPMRQEDWSAAKTRILEALAAEDFAAAKISESLAEVDPARATARLRVVLDSGPAFTFGGLRVRGLARYSEGLVERLSKISRGDRFSQAKLLELQSALQNSPYFSSVLVEVARDPAAPREVPVEVEVAEAQTRRLGFGLGASTNYGPRGEVNYRDVNWLDRALGLELGLRADQLRSAAFVDVGLPVRAEGSRDSVGVLRETTDIQGLATRRHAFGANREWAHGKLQTRVSVNWQRESSETSDGQAFARNALSLNAAWSWRDIDNPLDPRDGTLLAVQVGGGAKILLSDQNFARTYIRAQHYWPVGRMDVFTARAELGITAALDRQGIPEEFLFRAGGAQSVRGYAYQSLGVKDGSAVVGGRFLSVLSAEYTHWLDAKWGVATFVDAGNVTDARDSFRYLYGAGLGARWRSPAGPLALDLAYGERDRKVRAHFAVMIAF